MKRKLNDVNLNYFTRGQREIHWKVETTICIGQVQTIIILKNGNSYQQKKWFLLRVANS